MGTHANVIEVHDDDEFAKDFPRRVNLSDWGQNKGIIICGSYMTWTSPLQQDF